MKTTFRKIRKNAKALSPVVASIILIAVTVAVSVAVAAWMGGMTIGFMGTSSVTVTNVAFVNDGDNITLSLKNTGTKTATVASVKVNNVAVAFDPSGTYVDAASNSIAAGASFEITLEQAWIDGNTYKIDLYDGSNQVIGSVQQNAPGA